MRQFREFFKFWRNDRRRRRKAARPFRSSLGHRCCCSRSHADLPRRSRPGRSESWIGNADHRECRRRRPQLRNHAEASIAEGEDRRGRFVRARCRGHGQPLLVGHPGRNRAFGLESRQRSPLGLRRVWPSECSRAVAGAGAAGAPGARGRSEGGCTEPDSRRGRHRRTGHCPQAR